MKQSKFKLIKMLYIKYRKTVNRVIFITILFGFNMSFLIASKKIAIIKAGEYPEQPIAIRNKLLSKAMPGIIINSIIIGFLIMIVTFIIGLIIRFRCDYNIYLIHEIKLYLKKKKESKKE